MKTNPLVLEIEAETTNCNLCGRQLIPHQKTLLNGYDPAESKFVVFAICPLCLPLIMEGIQCRPACDDLPVLRLSSIHWN
jgi:hypothetical protein